jgi:hypothetical protein
MPQFRKNFNVTLSEYEAECLEAVRFHVSRKVGKMSQVGAVRYLIIEYFKNIKIGGESEQSNPGIAGSADGR